MLIGGNPTLSRVRGYCEDIETIVQPATYGGIAAKSIFFVLLTFFAAVGSFFGLLFIDGILYNHSGLIIGLLIGSSIISFILVMVGIRNPNVTKYVGTIYAVLQGFVMGFTALMVTQAGFGGEVFSAILATIGVFAIMMVLYSTGVIRVGNRFRKFMLSALLGVIFINLIMFVLGLIVPSLWTLFFGNSFLSIAISVIMVALASFMILLDLDRMTQIVNAGLDKRYEWVASFGLLITLIWLYMEFLRLFIRLASRNR